jgi:xylulokinase
LRFDVVSEANGPLLLAIDAGTDSLRVSLFDVEGRTVAIAKRSYRMVLGEHGIAEQDPDVIWSALRDAIATLATGEASGALTRVASVGVTAAIGLVVSDAHGAPLRPIMMWQDRRALRESEELITRHGRNGLFPTSGRPIDPELALCKLAWIARHEKAIAARIASAYTLKDWIVHRLCGERVTDPSSASYSLGYDVFAGRWNRALIEDVGLDPAAMPPVLAATAIAGRTSSRIADLGLHEGIAVAVGGPDGTMGALGAGMIASGSAVDVIGTTDVVFTVVDRPLLDRTSRTITNAYVEPSRWAIGGPLGLTGGALRWFVETFGPLEAPGATSSFAALDVLARAIAPGADGLLFFPGLTGDRVPWWEPRARGALVGLSARHGRAHVGRALLEGCAFLVADTFDAIEHVGATVSEVRVAGGGAASTTWLGIRASALGRALLVPEQIEASSLGAAIVAGVAGGIYESASAGVAVGVRIARVVEPDRAACARYRELRAIMSELRPYVDRASKALQRDAG